MSWSGDNLGNDRRLSQRRSRNSRIRRTCLARLEALYWHELLLRSNRMAEHLLPVPEWRNIETMKLISPGICIQFEPSSDFEKPLCGQNIGTGKAPPLWFAAAVQTFLGSHAAVGRPITARDDDRRRGRRPSQIPTLRSGWPGQHILDSIGVALLMAMAIAVLASLAIAHTLAPARSIVVALQRMAHGQYRTSLPRFRSMELSMIGQAVSDLGRPPGAGHGGTRRPDPASS